MTFPEGFSYYADFLTPYDQKALAAELRHLEFTHDHFRGQQLRRCYAQFGYAYVSTGRKLRPTAPFPDFLAALVGLSIPYCPVGTRFNQCIITHYPPGAGIGWHTDADQFGETIIAVSLAGDARLQFRPKGSNRSTHELIATSGSLYTMRGPARWDYQHQIKPVRTDRYSVTCRQVKP